jgi:putative membrane protein
VSQFWYRCSRSRSSTRLAGDACARARVFGTGWRTVGGSPPIWGVNLLIMVALISPIDVLGGQLFFMHMIQHFLLVMLAPPLLMLANPLPFILWGLPDSGRRQVGGLLSTALHREVGLPAAGAFGDRVRVSSGCCMSFSCSVGTNRISTTRRCAAILCMMSSISPSSCRRCFTGGTSSAPGHASTSSSGDRLAWLMSLRQFRQRCYRNRHRLRQPADLQLLPGVPRLWGLDVLSDQRISGVIMWIPGSMMYIIAVLILAARWLQREERKPPLLVSRWATDERMAAPGLDRS